MNVDIEMNEKVVSVRGGHSGSEDMSSAIRMLTDVKLADRKESDNRPSPGSAISSVLPLVGTIEKRAQKSSISLLEELKRFRVVKKRQSSGLASTSKMVKLDTPDRVAIVSKGQRRQLDQHNELMPSGWRERSKNYKESRMAPSIVITDALRTINRLQNDFKVALKTTRRRTTKAKVKTATKRKIKKSRSRCNLCRELEQCAHVTCLKESSCPGENSSKGAVGEVEKIDGLAPEEHSLPTAITVATTDEDANHPPTSGSSLGTPVYEQEVLPKLIIEELTPAEKAIDDRMRASDESFLQHVPCFKLPNSDDINKKGNIPRCRECRARDSVLAQLQPTAWVYCRFLEFRRLKYDVDGVLTVSGFPNPHTDPKREDLIVWQPDDRTEPTAGYMDVQVCRYILLHVGDQFCYLWRQEVEALQLHENPNGPMAWKKAVRGVREICDVCDTTLFNYHWTCEKCGFGLCLDCFKDRKEQRICPKLRNDGKPQCGRDEFFWLLCTGTAPQQRHDVRHLMLTQIITDDSLNVLGKMLHEVRALWQIPQLCGCSFSQKSYRSAKVMKTFAEEMIKKSEMAQHTSASSMATAETHRQEKLMKELHKEKVEHAAKLGINYVPGRRLLSMGPLDKDPITTAFDNLENITFQRQGLAGLRRFLPTRAMTLTAARLLAPQVPHEWLCDGKLLRLTNPIQPDNRILFQEVWKCGQPVVISEVARSLNLELWRPEAFSADFGDKPNDLINCLNGNLLPNQPMKLFWDGFQCIRKRLCDSNGQPMLLKLKDWPPGDDFAEILPTRYEDLMGGLPLPEYTLRTGNLNMASCLPKMFVPPDLGPKMYNAYGSALHPDKGTTNLHLDISDAVNIMVYVGIPEDGVNHTGSDHRMATQRAIDMGGSDYLTRARSLGKRVIPGALWHIFPARDADKIRDLLNRITLEKGYRLEPDHDPIHDQNWYLDEKLRQRLFREYGVEGYPIVQCLGDAVFIPAGAPHQVQNLHNCIKVAEDFVSPENITHCYHLSYEFRRLSHSHTNHEDKLQIKNIIFHAVKDCCHILMRVLDERVKFELESLERRRQNYDMLSSATDGVEFITNLSKFKYN